METNSIINFEIWSLIFQGLLVLVSIIGVVIAYIKSTEYIKDREERFRSEVKWRTEKAYENYRICETLTTATKRVFEASNKGTDYSKIEFNHDIATIVNYLESLSIGIEQKIYNEDMLKDYFKESVYKCTKVFLLGEDGDVNGRSWKSKKPVIIDPKEQPHLIKLFNRWYPTSKYKV
jgi:hypothetical protein